MRFVLVPVLVLLAVVPGQAYDLCNQYLRSNKRCFTEQATVSYPTAFGEGRASCLGVCQFGDALEERLALKQKTRAVYQEAAQYNLPGLYVSRCSTPSGRLSSAFSKLGNKGYGCKHTVGALIHTLIDECARVCFPEKFHGVDFPFSRFSARLKRTATRPSTARPSTARPSTARPADPFESAGAYSYSRSKEDSSSQYSYSYSSTPHAKTNPYGDIPSSKPKQHYQPPPPRNTAWGEGSERPKPKPQPKPQPRPAPAPVKSVQTLLMEPVPKGWKGSPEATANAISLHQALHSNEAQRELGRDVAAMLVIQRVWDLLINCEVIKTEPERNYDIKSQARLLKTRLHPDMLRRHTAAYQVLAERMGYTGEGVSLDDVFTMLGELSKHVNTSMDEL